LSSQSIYQFINRCRKETKRCEDAHAYLACIILLGATLEYMLSAWIRAFPQTVYAHRRKLTDHWNLKDLNELAYRTDFFDYGAFRASERIRKFRNLVHPNWYAGRKPLRFTKRILDARISDYNKVMESVQKNI
jgi:hypothetical protein